MQILTTSQASPAYSHNPHHNNFPVDTCLLILGSLVSFAGLNVAVQRGFVRAFGLPPFRPLARAALRPACVHPLYLLNCAASSEPPVMLPTL
jgi:hypothetical protein